MVISSAGASCGTHASGITGAPETQRKWHDDKRRAFEVLEPAAISLVATDGPVSVTLFGRGGEVKRLGHNRGIWPAKIARTASRKDTVTATHDQSPFYFMGTQWRLWCPSVALRDQLASAVTDLIAERASIDGGMAELRRGFLDLGPELDLEMFQLEAMDIARRKGVACWDDDGLSVFLDRVSARVVRRKAAGVGYVNETAAIEAAIEDELAEEERRRA